jgi:hypothetical protein
MLTTVAWRWVEAESKIAPKLWASALLQELCQDGGVAKKLNPFSDIASLLTVFARVWMVQSGYLYDQLETICSRCRGGSSNARKCNVWVSDPTSSKGPATKASHSGGG